VVAGDEVRIFANELAVGANNLELTNEFVLGLTMVVLAPILPTREPELELEIRDALFPPPAA
jgi:hypothetical protein